MKQYLQISKSNSYLKIKIKYSDISLSMIGVYILLFFFIIIIPTSALAKKKVTGKKFREMLKSQTVIKDLEIIDMENYPHSAYIGYGMPKLGGDRLIENCTFNDYNFHLLNLSGRLIIKDCLFNSKRKFASDKNIPFYKCCFDEGLFLINCKSNSKIYAQCTFNYYQGAVNYINERVDNPVFYIYNSKKTQYLSQLYYSHEK